jgi:hypothetical protein
MPTIIAIHPSGFEVRFEVELGEINNLVHQLQKRRYRPSRELAYTAEGLPLCPRHGVPMQKREKQGDTWFSHKVTEPETGQVVYCRGYAGPSSPGFEVLPAAVTTSIAEAQGRKVSRVRTENATARAEETKNGRQVSGGSRLSGEADLQALNQELFG